MSGGNTYELQSLRGVSLVDDGEISVHPHPHPLGGGGVNSGSHNHNNGKVGSPEETRLGTSLRSRLVEKSWALELLAWCFAAVTFAILYAVLRVFNGKPLSHWNSSITVNTLVTLLTTIASTALIFPVASCIAQLRWLWLRKKEQSVAGLQSFGSGPVDIFVMIFKHPKMLLAYLGTINVILILLFGPITQETVALPIQQHPLGAGTGSIGACTTYQVTNPPRRDAVVPSGQRTRNGLRLFHYETVDRRMSPAIDLAITGTPADPSDVQAHCDKGNCTFGAYSTLGVCSRVDVVPHDSIVQTCPDDEYGEPMGCNYIVQELQTHPPWRIGNLTTGPRSDVPFSAASPPYTLWIGSSDIGSVPLTPEDSYNYMFPSPETLTEFYIVYVADTRGYMQGHSTPEFFSSIAALKVGLDLCVYQYNTSVFNGGTKTLQMSRTTDLKWAKDSVNASSATMGGKVYTMGELTIRQFSNYLGLEVFYGSSWIGNDIVTVGGLGAPATDTPNVFAGLLVNRSVSEGQDGVRKRMDNLAVGMTNALRMSGDEIVQIPGTALEPVIYISVNFHWLILPSLSLILTLLFLLAVIFETARSGVPAWKASPIAALLALDHDAGSAIAAQDHSRSLDARARELTLRLKSGGKQGWFLWKVINDVAARMLAKCR